MFARILFVVAASCCASQLLPPEAVSAPPPPAKMEKYTAGDNSFALYKPPGWSVEERVAEHGKAVTVSDPGGASFVVMKTLKMRDRKENAAAHASRMLKGLRSTVSRSTSARGGKT